jgi:ergothioneine biosynthesis protein EgtB
MIESFRVADASQLALALQDARLHTLAVFDCFAAAGLDLPSAVPQLDTLQPPLWELGHIAWFAEWQVLRATADASRHTSLLTHGDDWFDAGTVPHRARWHLGLPASGALKTYCREVLDRVLDKLGRLPVTNDAALYPYRLVLAYEDLRGEALAMALQQLGVAAPAALAGALAAPWAQGDIRFAGGSMELGSSGPGFAFDNEKPAHRVRVPACVMDSTLVTNAQFEEFIADGGYQQPRFWSAAGRAWLMKQERSAPRYWQRDGPHWMRAHFGQPVALAANQPVSHVSLYEAQAYCVWAERRLPSEEEWEFATLSRHPAWRWGDLWEWTGSAFEPYPGFEPDAYRDYSVPYFGSHQVLRGASFATRRRLRSPRFRQFFLPERDDPFAGFRTCQF